MRLSVLTYLLDTNVLIYLHDRRDETKRATAIRLVRRLGEARNTAVPAQALAEFANVALRKFKPPLEVHLVYQQIEKIEIAFPVMALTGAVVREAVAGVRDHKMSYYDAQIWAVARLSQIPIVLSEDFNPGSTIEGVTFLNPFLPNVEDTL